MDDVLLLQSSGGFHLSVGSMVGAIRAEDLRLKPDVVIAMTAADPKRNFDFEAQEWCARYSQEGIIAHLRYPGWDQTHVDDEELANNRKTEFTMIWH